MRAVAIGKIANCHNCQLVVLSLVPIQIKQRIAHCLSLERGRLDHWLSLLSPSTLVQFVRQILRKVQEVQAFSDKIASWSNYTKTGRRTGLWTLHQESGWCKHKILELFEPSEFIIELQKFMPPKISSKCSFFSHFNGLGPWALTVRDTDTHVRGSTNMMSGREIGVNCKADRVVYILKKSKLVCLICAILVKICAHGTN